MITRSVTDLRRAFDETFARPITDAVDGSQQLLALPIGSDHYLLQLRELSGLFAGRRIIALPTRESAFLGVVGIRGAVLPAWDLAALLGRPPSGPTARWLALVGTSRVGLAFASFGGHVRLPSTSDLTPDREAGAHVRAVVRNDGVIHRVVDIPSILSAIEQEPR